MSNARPVRNLRRGTKPQHHPAYRRLTDLLREARARAGLTQRELAKLLKKPPSYIHKGEVGSRRLDFREAVEWLDALGVDVTEAAKTVRR